MNYIKGCLVSLLVSASANIYPQEILDKKQAVNLLLENNYDVLVANNNIEIAENNTSVYNNGYLPTITGNAGANYSNNQITATRQDGSSTTLEGATNDNYNASVNLNYTVFDGFRRKYSSERAQSSFNQSELQLRSTVENSILVLFQNYYEVARLTENLAVLKQTLEISKNRLKRAGYQFDYGQNSNLDVSNAEVDVNTDSINYLNTLQLLENSKRNLNTVIGRDVNTPFSVDTLVLFSSLLQKEELYATLKENNISLLQAQQSVSLSEYDIKINNSAYLPTIGVTGSYGWNQSNNNEASFLASSASRGINAGVSLTWSLFDGGRTMIGKQNAVIGLDNQRILKDQVEQFVTRDFDNAWGDYNNRLFVLAAQEKNLATNRINFERTEEQYKIGRVTSIEFRQAQINLLNAQTNRNQAKYDAKLAELLLVQLGGGILEATF